MSDYFCPAKGSKGKNNTEPYMNLEAKKVKNKPI